VKVLFLRTLLTFSNSFWTHYQAGDDSVKATIIQFARSKLTGEHPQTEHGMEQGRDLPDTAKIAILSTRLLLEFEPGREISQRTETELIEKHMRMHIQSHYTENTCGQAPLRNPY
jgi:hypothetical protein